MAMRLCQKRDRGQRSMLRKTDCAGLNQLFSPQPGATGERSTIRETLASPANRAQLERH